MRNAFADTLFNAISKDQTIFLLAGDLGFGVLNRFSEYYPKQWINTGIAEQNMTLVAAGLALEGKKVFTYSIANFSTLRCLEQIRNDIAYHDLDVNIISVGAGLAYGSSGMSHHATEDIAIMRAIPNIKVLSPCDPLDAKAATQYAIESKSPCYIRLGKGNEKPIFPEEHSRNILEAYCLRQGTDTAIFATGSIIEEALLASDILQSNGISCAIYAFTSIKPLNDEMILQLAKTYSHIFTLEEHNIIGGFGSAIAEIVSEYSVKAIIKRIGIPDVLTSEIGSQSYLRNYYGINGKNIASNITETLTSKTKG